MNDEGDVDMQTTQDVAGPLRHAAQIGHGSQKLMEACVKAHARGNFVLTLGGDHSVALGTVAAALQARPATKVSGSTRTRTATRRPRRRRATRTACRSLFTEARAIVGARRGVVSLCVAG